MYNKLSYGSHLKSAVEGDMTTSMLTNEASVWKGSKEKWMDSLMDKPGLE